jgi:hypothetical protein
MLPVVYVLMVLSPTTKTPPSWHPYTVAESKEECEQRAPEDILILLQSSMPEEMEGFRL